MHFTSYLLSMLLVATPSLASAVPAVAGATKHKHCTHFSVTYIVPCPKKVCSKRPPPKSQSLKPNKHGSFN
ncbi:hypothetical protein Vi05172_g6683 [Venturia inaequalis]|nr:hypothetical protein Vi05172_g6683 [Venturia inaequalis]